MAVHPRHRLIPSPPRSTTLQSPGGSTTDSKLPTRRTWTSPFNANFPADSPLKAHTSDASDITCCKASTSLNQSTMLTRKVGETTTLPARNFQKTWMQTAEPVPLPSTIMETPSATRQFRPFRTSKMCFHSWLVWDVRDTRV